LFALGQCSHDFKSAKFAYQVAVQVQLPETLGKHHQSTTNKASHTATLTLYRMVIPIGTPFLKEKINN